MNWLWCWIVRRNDRQTTGDTNSQNKGKTVRLIHDGQTIESVVPGIEGISGDIKVKFRPLVSWETDLFKRTTGRAQADILAEKLVEWDCTVSPEDVVWLEQQGLKVKAGDPLPIKPVVLQAIPGGMFELLYITVILSAEKREQQLKN